MSDMGTNGTGAVDTRGGKYCPRCQTMAFRDQAVCAYCGHQFRTGTAPAAAPPTMPNIAPTPAPADLHRTQQFSLPPVTRTPPPVAAPEPPPLPILPIQTTKPLPLWPLGLAGLALLLLIGFFVWKRPAVPAPIPSPAGAWTTTLRGTGAGARSADLKFVFAADGGGTYALGTTPPAPLHWTQTGNTLFLTLMPPTPPDTQYSTLVTIFNNRPWVWKRDSASHTLRLGTLIFTETP